MKALITRESFITVCVNLFLLFVCCTKWNAGFSISAGLVIAGILYCLAKKEKFTLPPKAFLMPYLCFLGTVTLASFLTGDPGSIRTARNFIAYSLPVWVTYFALQKVASLWDATQWGLLGGSWVLAYYPMKAITDGHLYERLRGPFAAYNHMGMTLEALLPFLYLTALHHWYTKRGSARILYTLLFGGTALFMTVALLMSQSRGAIAGFFVGLMVVFLYSIFNRKTTWKMPSRIVIFVVLLSVCATSFFAISRRYQVRSYDHERVLLLHSAYHMWQDHKVYGVGFDRWNEVYRAHYILPGAHEPTLTLPHNDIANFFSGTGTLGGIGYLAFLASNILLLLYVMKKQPENLFPYGMLWYCIGLLLIHGMVDNTFYAKYELHLYFAFWGIALGSKAQSEKN
ncbi:MAG: O-antigen ligase family protein [Acidaminococcus provencensis]|uniref:O-antigen ligase family protein n=1 Tax=Acidaminococcus provencensis TaxID=2058289 RepID=UPI0023F13187|nr:O-antigen ligase family protein [Acidaminococcus provencensis]MCH4096288.1 O-antigen ligase family protein [Acidaminococcus provencensis]